MGLLASGARWQVKVASILLGITAVGFGVFCLPAIRSLLAGRGIPIVMGFPAYGDGPFERVGIRTTVPLVAGFLAVCILEGVAAWLLWGGHRSGAILALVTVPLGAVYWWGFALPIPPILVGISIVLVLLSWGTLS
jgi:hypothetical protein